MAGQNKFGSNKSQKFWKKNKQIKKVNKNFVLGQPKCFVLGFFGHFKNKKKRKGRARFTKWPEIGATAVSLIIGAGR